MNESGKRKVKNTKKNNEMTKNIVKNAFIHMKFRSFLLPSGERKPETTDSCGRQRGVAAVSTLPA
jgi:hypothetical protein